MSLPTHIQLEELSLKIDEIVRGKHGKVDGNWYTYSAVHEAISKSTSGGGNSEVYETVLTKALTTGLTQAGKAAGVVVAGPIGHVFPFGLVLAPWIGAASIYIKSNGLFSLYDIKQAINQGAPNSYQCHCKKCGDNIQYIIDKHQRKINVKAVSIFTAGIPLIAQGLNSIRKSFQSGRPKEKVSQALIKSARTEGCTAAMATIFHLSGGSFFAKRTSPEVLNAAVAIIVSKDWKELKSRW